MRSSRLLVFDYNRTGFLEAIAQNIPSILVCDFTVCELSTAASDDFDRLTRCEVHFQNPSDAAKHVNRIWETVEQWWNNDGVRDAVSHIRARYCQSIPNKVEKIAGLLINELSLAS